MLSGMGSQNVLKVVCFTVGLIESQVAVRFQHRAVHGKSIRDLMKLHWLNVLAYETVWLAAD